MTDKIQILEMASYWQNIQTLQILTSENSKSVTDKMQVLEIFINEKNYAVTDTIQGLEIPTNRNNKKFC